MTIKDPIVRDGGVIVKLVVQRVYPDGHRGPFVRMTALDLADKITEDVTASLLPPVWKEDYLPKEGEILQSCVSDIRSMRVKRDGKPANAWRAYTLKPVTPVS